MVPQRKTSTLIRIIQGYLGMNFTRILVVGCGSGLEAEVLSKAFKAEVVGIDLNPSFSLPASPYVELRQGDATHLDFADGYFDLIYSFHVLEHIPQYALALSEMARVLVDGGGVLIGIPNRSRWIGYLGSGTASFSEKISWNLEDWCYRFRGRFKNEYGAHAGFLSSELRIELEKVFAQVDEITLPYYLALYSTRTYVIQLLARLRLGRLFFPGLYFIGRK